MSNETQQLFHSSLENTGTMYVQCMLTVSMLLAYN